MPEWGKHHQQHCGEEIQGRNFPASRRHAPPARSLVVIHLLLLLWVDRGPHYCIVKEDLLPHCTSLNLIALSQVRFPVLVVFSPPNATWSQPLSQDLPVRAQFPHLPTILGKEIQPSGHNNSMKTDRLSLARGCGAQVPAGILVLLFLHYIRGQESELQEDLTHPQLVGMRSVVASTHHSLCHYRPGHQ